MYCTTSEVYAAGQIDSTVVAESTVESFIKSAEQEVDLVTYTTYWVPEDNGTASDGDANTLTDASKDWTVDAYSSNTYVWVYSGTGSGQVRKVVSNTATALTVDSPFSTPPDVTSLYRIIYTGSVPIPSDEPLDGTGTDTLFVPMLPIVDIESLDIANNRDTSTSLSLDSLYVYKRTGKIVLSSDSEVKLFYNNTPQSTTLSYSFGVYTIPEIVKQWTILSAAERMLSAQMGGTYNVPSTYSLPEGSVTIGQAYINIDSTAKRLNAEKKELAKILRKYAVVY